MDWLINLFTQHSVAQTLVIYSIVIALGTWLGRFKIGSISLGVTFVLFAGILIGHLGFTVDNPTLIFLRDFGLILFIFSIGLQVGPTFFSSLRHNGKTLNLYALGAIGLSLICTVGLYYALRQYISLPMIVGVMSGAITNTPGLGAAQEAMTQLGIDEPIALSYAVAYPIGILGAILSVIAIRLLFKIDMNTEEQLANKSSKNAAESPHKLSIRITNPALDNLSLQHCQDLIGRRYVVSRMVHDEHTSIPNADSILHVGDCVLVICSGDDKEAVLAFFGEEIEMNWDKCDSELVSRRIVITRDNINGKTIRQLHLRTTYGINITRVNRSGIDLIAQPELVLQMGDRVMVVGEQKAIEKVEPILGNSLKKLNNPPIITLFLGIFVGIIVGMIPIRFPDMPTPVKLGLAGGPLVVSILLGAFGYRLKLITYTTQSANLMIREIGISLFLASVGINAGGDFVETVLSTNGLLWMGLAFVITFVPLVTIGILARKISKMNFITIMGLLAGSTTNAALLAYTSNLSSNDQTAVGYSTVYPLTMFLRIVCAQMLILLLA
ncbi:MAG: putative transporter [Paludibacteraceae bacterium]|nr:putative transporter [Paludibacteraceae bacterium]